jgi:hypothetical protein
MKERIIKEGNSTLVSCTSTCIDLSVELIMRVNHFLKQHNTLHSAHQVESSGITLSDTGSQLLGAQAIVFPFLSPILKVTLRLWCCCSN